MKVFIYIVIGIVVVSVVAGFFIVGSPQQERLRRFDEKRISDLQMIQNELINYWQTKQTLPRVLPDLNDSLRGFAVPKDPQTGASYEYEVASELTFSLCANFNLESRGAGSAQVGRYPVVAPGGSVPTDTSYWDHSAGRYCFKRSIDKDLFKPAKFKD